MNIGIFSGSFNPIHVGHLILADYVVEFAGIDKVWFIVSPQNPWKEEDELLSEQVRMQMVEIALEKYPKLEACDIEFSMPKPSYTIKTIETLQAKYPNDTFYLIIGADNWEAFEDWKEYDRILKICNIKVYPRLGSHILIPDRLKSRVEALEAPIIEISSTFIRESIANKKNMRAFLPEKVYEFIEENKLYL